MKIGKRIRQLRKEKALTLEELSQKSGVALATLSRMENNKMTGTLDSHHRICKVLGAALSDLYKEVENESKTVETVSNRQRTEHLVHDDKVKFELLVTKTMNKKLAPVMIKIQAEGVTQLEEYEIGIEKFIYMLTGSLEAKIGENSYVLKNGDSIYFDASLPHILKNNSTKIAEVLCVTSTNS